MDIATEPLDKLVTAYLGKREGIKERKAEFEESLKADEEEFETLAAELLRRCNEQNAETIRTACGTISRRLVSRYWTSDWSAMYKFISEQNAPYLLEQRIHNGNMQQFLGENPTLLPEGLQANRKYTVQVRKPSNSQKGSTDE